MSPASSSFSAAPMKPGAKSITSNGAPATPTRVTASSTAPRVPATRSTKPFSSSRVRRSLYSVSTGTKATEKAPSANSRRRKLGILKATKKASVLALAPNTWANTRSRRNPRTRDSRVLEPTLARDLNMAVPVTPPR